MKTLKTVLTLVFTIVVAFLSVFLVIIAGMMAYRKTEQKRRN